MNIYAEKQQKMNNYSFLGQKLYILMNIYTKRCRLSRANTFLKIKDIIRQMRFSTIVRTGHSKQCTLRTRFRTYDHLHGALSLNADHAERHS